ncbi:MFS transporter [Deinococcus yavapaiensis]|uniref:MFS transporter n=1 Tax=Deinococcus yavapaiensis KR-236 TaxID=694435 RepID=A0A318S5R4_9DEIO|nr:MFS transporter [Deinococcus yavapaiensis]PYE52945.1 MFS transporter [Deinococcus yavapaiensis KR-236]
MRRLRLPAPSEWADSNYRLGVLNGWIVYIGDGFFNSSIVLAAFVSKLGAPNTVIGLLPAIQGGGWMLPQILVAALIRAKPYKLPVYRSAATIRTLSYLWMVASTVLLISNPSLLLVSFLLGMIVNALASGVSGLPFLEVVSKVIAPPKRAAFFGTRNLFGGILAFLAGLVVREVLASPIPFPYNYTVLLAFGTVAYTVGYALFGRIKEQPDPPLPPSNVKAELAAIPVTLREDPHFRAFLGVRLLLAFASLGDPFYAVFALRELGMPSSMLGVFLMALSGAAPLSNILWTRVAQRRGSRRIIRMAAVVALAAPLLALVVPGDLPFLYLLVFVSASVAGTGFNLGHTNHLLNLAPPDRRGRYIGTLNTLVGAALFAPVIGGFLADRFGYRSVFVVSIVLYAAAWWRSGRLRRDA